MKKGSNVDNHAAVNTTSVYTAAEIFPMLPEKLSTNLTSLNPDEDRLAVVVEMTVAADGAVTQSAIYRAHVRNHAKLAYNGVAAWLDGSAAAPAALAAVPGLEEQLRRQSRVAQALKRMREERGALQLDTLETRPIFSDDTLADLAPDESNRAKELIEDFMVAANGVVARFLAQQGDAVAAPRAAHAAALGPHRGARRASRREAAGAARRRRARRVPAQAAPGRSRSLRRSFAVDREAARLGRVRARTSRARPRRGTSRWR